LFSAEFSFIEIALLVISDRWEIILLLLTGKYCQVWFQTKS